MTVQSQGIFDDTATSILYPCSLTKAIVKKQISLKYTSGQGYSILIELLEF